MENVTIISFKAYNPSRYSTPWVCRMTRQGSYDFNAKVGSYTGRNGEEGDLVVCNPVVDQVYGYGQKDYRKSRNSWISYAKWDGEDFIPCDKFGRVKEK